MSSKIYDEVTDFEVCGSTKNKKIEKETLFFLQIQKHLSFIRGKKMVRNNFFSGRNLYYHVWKNSNT